MTYHAPVQCLCSCLQITQILSGFAVYFGASVSSSVSAYGSYIGNYTSNSSCPTDSTAGGISGPSIGQLTATANLDSSFYSWVGCNCSNESQERAYDIQNSGTAHSQLATSTSCLSSQNAMLVYVQNCIGLGIAETACCVWWQHVYLHHCQSAALERQQQCMHANTATYARCLSSSHTALPHPIKGYASSAKCVQALQVSCPLLTCQDKEAAEVLLNDVMICFGSERLLIEKKSTKEQ